MAISVECPEFLKPRLRLFLSADIIGSTAQKQSRLGAFKAGAPEQEASWFATIQGFYFEAQHSFISSWETLRTAHGDDRHFGEPPKLWKTIGDEVVFTKIITDYRQIAVTIQCWTEALKKIRKFLVRDGARLGVKSTIWSAGFPFRNKEVVLAGDRFNSEEPVDDYYKENGIILNRVYSDDPPKDVVLDFIGPSIDTGFRLTQHATARRLILSVEVAYTLSLTSPISAGPIAPIELHYAGQKELKGVIGGAGYPVFWIDLSEGTSAASLEDKITQEASCDRDAIRHYCDAFFAENEDLIFPPFIVHTDETTLTRRPGWYDKGHGALVKNFRDSVAPPPEPEPVAENPVEFHKDFDAFKLISEEIAARLNAKGPGTGSGSHNDRSPLPS